MKFALALALVGLCSARPAPLVARDDDWIKAGPAAGSQADIDLCLKVHNDARAAVGHGPMTWDSALASGAKDYAGTLAGMGQLKHSQGGNYGENLFQGWGDKSGFGPGASYMIETEWRNYVTGAKMDGSNYDHYTQVIWPKTTKVGAGIATDSSGRTWVVYRYSEPGNVMGQVAATQAPDRSNMPTTYDPNSTSSSSSGKSSTGTQSTGTQSTGTQSSGTQSTGDQSTGTQSTGTQSSGTQSSGNQSTGNQSTGNQSTGTQSTGTQSSGTQSSGTQSSAPQSPPSNSGSRWHGWHRGSKMAWGNRSPRSAPKSKMAAPKSKAEDCD